MPGISYGGGSPTGDAPDHFLKATEGMGGYPHSGQGLPSGVTGLDLVQMLRAQKAKSNAQNLAPRTSQPTGLDAVGAPADFPGVVLPNPNHITPMKDTDQPVQTPATFSTGTYRGGRTGYTQNGRQLWPDIQLRAQ